MRRILQGVPDASPDAAAGGVVADFDRLMRYRSSTRSEIDFVAQDFQGVAVESTYVDDQWGRDLQTLSASPWRGVLATRSGIALREDAAVIPAPLVALLLGA